MTHCPFTLEQDSYGQLILTLENGDRHSGVTPVRAFPIAAPDEGLSLVSDEGHEVAWIERLDTLPEGIRILLDSVLASREFVPEILAIASVSSFACPSTWEVSTNRGKTQLILKGEEDIRRLSRTQLLIADSHGIQFLVREIDKLDRHSRKLLDRFL